MAKRIGLSKKLRFEVFKRDSFRCQYCGKSAPDAILECDHIIPVAEGGQNELLNLVTACVDCNRGKGKTLLADKSTVAKQKAQLDEMQKQREQLEMLLQWKEELASMASQQVDAIDNLIMRWSGFQMSNVGRNGIEALLRRFGFEEVFTATQISLEKYFNGSQQSMNYAHSKIGGICYNRKHGRTAGGG